jgi:hypothetical protein
LKQTTLLPFSKWQRNDVNDHENIEDNHDSDHENDKDGDKEEHTNDDSLDETLVLEDNINFCKLSNH